MKQITKWATSLQPHNNNPKIAIFQKSEKRPRGGQKKTIVLNRDFFHFHENGKNTNISAIQRFKNFERNNLASVFLTIIHKQKSIV